MRDDTKEKDMLSLQHRIRKFSRIEKAFYASIILTAIIMAVGIIFLQSRNLQQRQEISHLNSQITQKQTEYDDVKQEVNELMTRERVTEIAKKAGLSNKTGNIQKVD
ncbi:cell division protein FtsL [Streptococcus sp. SQ9-PEA]|uniref:Cell division protein FtsL n=2 Tax=Streptococcus sciuri TaxID=2973939 RepID=A0ABT2F9C9_9STRE|nr:cell division protein FtsL [Streptococcus sciuri]MCS4488621.1 cell division protein FtsL [Streptococcus sciuri]